MAEYKVVIEDQGCPHCGHGTVYTVEDSAGIGIGTSWGGHVDDEQAREVADDYATLLNEAFERATELAKREIR